MSQRTQPTYLRTDSTQTLRQGIEEYYAANPGITDPRQMPPDFARILLAHDACHVILGCDTDMYDEIRLLPLSFWVTDNRFKDYLQERQSNV
jgi:hypothetical protein